MKNAISLIKTIGLGAILAGLIIAMIVGEGKNPLKKTTAAVNSVSAQENIQNAEGEEVVESVGDTAGSDAEETGADTTAAAKPEGLPDIDINSWEYILANSTHSISDYEPPELGDIEDAELDSRIMEPMMSFIGAARDQGLSVILASGYRSYETQTWLFENKVAQYDGDEETAATIVARPGTSEHQTGLAADITDQYYEMKTQDLENTELYKWMSAHCQEYGFIVRFPKGKEDITGIIYEPWHFRYVGVEAASYIMEHDLTLEEFVELYQ